MRRTGSNWVLLSGLRLRTPISGPGPPIQPAGGVLGRGGSGGWGGGGVGGGLIGPTGGLAGPTPFWVAGDSGGPGVWVPIEGAHSRAAGGTAEPELDPPGGTTGMPLASSAGA